MTYLFEHTILLVDDEQSITRSLHRLLRKEKCRILAAASGQEGLDILAKTETPVSLIISDQRMPVMTGAQFLEKARQLAPNAIRFLLTGYADVKDILDAVNKGEIHRYLTKPWNDDELLLQVRHALELYELHSENQRLNALTRHQNKELIALNQDLEKKVQERTEEIRQKNKALEAANVSLEKSFVDTIRLLSSLVETLNPYLGKYLNAVAQLSKRMARRLALENQDVEHIEIAGMLHDIGLMGLPQAMLRKEPEEMTESELKLFKQHPIIGQLCLQPVERLDPVGVIVFSHHENVDGTGFPNALSGEEIPVGAKIIRIAADFTGMIVKWPKDAFGIRQKAMKYLGNSAVNIAIEDPRILAQEIIKQLLFRQVKRLYDPDIFNCLAETIEEDKETGRKSSEKSVSISVWFLKPGMKLNQELRIRDGRLLLTRNSVLSASMISAIQKLATAELIDERVETTVG
jgi:response regulator RpfG family c-di-GMP phosphodiesterase